MFREIRYLNLSGMCFLGLILHLLLVRSALGGLTDYFSGVKTYFGYDSRQSRTLEGFEANIPYEVAEPDQKFISQAIELTGVALSELDACQHRLILKLKSDCYMMNDLQVSKLAVGLLNCQSYIEGRQIYPCTEEMTLKQCTSEMNADVWNSYHLMTNRARAVCYSIRHTQFRGLTEQTVNQLMQASQKQLHTLNKISKDQEELQGIAENTIEYINKGHQDLAQQQKDLQKAQYFGQLQIEDNINKLADEKRLIIESQKQLAELTKTLQDELANAAAQIQKHFMDTNNNHNEILDDLMVIQEKAQIIFKKIDESSNILIQQSELATRQYQVTLNQLNEMNSTVTSLVALVGGTKIALEERLAWLSEIVGGADEGIEKLYICLCHFLLLVVSMIVSAFVNATFATRLAVIIAIPGNFVLHILKSEYVKDPFVLSAFLLGFIIIQSTLLHAWKFSQQKQQFNIGVSSQSLSATEITEYTKKSPSPLKKLAKLDTPPRSESRGSTRSCSTTTPYNFEFNEEVSFLNNSTPKTIMSDDVRGLKKLTRRGSRDTESRDRFDEYLSPTPPLTNNSIRSPRTLSSGGTCSALTRVGTHCRNTVSAGRDVCYRHIKGDSIAR